MSLTKQDVEHLAKLARLKLSDQELETYRLQLSGVLGYVAKLNEVDTTGVEPTTQVTGQVNEFRDDVVKPSDGETRDSICGQFPERIGDHLRVPSVF